MATASPDSSDPSPWDYHNFSAANGISWQGDVARRRRQRRHLKFLRPVSERLLQRQRAGVRSWTAMGSRRRGPARRPIRHDLSPVNGGLWYTAALADADGDGNPNFTDPWPYDPTNGNLPPEWNSPTADTDADGIPNAAGSGLGRPAELQQSTTARRGMRPPIGDIDGDGIAQLPGLTTPTIITTAATPGRIPTATASLIRRIRIPMTQPTVARVAAETRSLSLTPTVTAVRIRKTPIRMTPTTTRTSTRMASRTSETRRKPMLITLAPSTVSSGSVTCARRRRWGWSAKLLGS
jgi:hypothetical protein